MDSIDQQVMTVLAGVDSGIVYQQMVPAFANDNRFAIGTTCNNWGEFERTLEQLRPELLVTQASIAPSPDQLIKALSRLNIWNGVAIVLINPDEKPTQSLFERVASVRRVITLPAHWGEVTEVGYSVVITERTKKISSETMIPTAKTQQAVSTLTGVSTVAFISASGGTGRTTLAENIGYELGRTGAKTLLMSMDLPTPTPLHMHLRTTPDAAEYFSNPKEGFNRCIQRYADLLEVILAPESSMSYAKYGSYDDDAGSVYGLVHQTWNKTYGAILLDLPAGEGPWMMQPLLAANKVVIVARPTLADLRGVLHIMELITSVINRDVQIPKTNIFLVVSQFTERSTFSPDQIIKELSQQAGWNPMLAGTIMYDPIIPLIQDNQELPIVKNDEYAKSIRAIISRVFQISINDQKQKGSILGGIFRK